MVLDVSQDPSLRMLRSGFGKQVPSTASTVAAFGFGTAGRDSYQKLYLSPEQTKTMSGNNSMGAVYKCFDSIGPQPDSKFPSAPAAGFGTSTRSIKYGGVTPGPGKYETKGAIGKQADSKKENQSRTVFGTSTRDQTVKLGCEEELLKTIAYGRASPGPCTYNATSGHGKQVDGTKASSPAFKMGTSSRFSSKNPMTDVPGVGSYASAVPAYGKQVLSSKSTLPTPKMGTSTRDQALKVFISKEHGKATFGLTSPGPATGPRPNSFGVQTLSQKKTNPTWGFGTSKRAPTYDNGVPGPGNYYA